MTDDVHNPGVYTAEPMTRPVSAVVRPPGSKSATNRALIIASLAGGGVSRLSGCLDADDTFVMREALRALGVVIDDVDDPWLVSGSGGHLAVPSGPIDVQASGTTARFITAVAALVKGPVEIDGTERMRQRPIGDLTAALTRMGVNVETENGTPPVRLNGGSLSGGIVAVDGSRSSQFVSALLMISPMVPDPVTIEITGELVSSPYVDSTIEMMRSFGAEVVPGPNRYEVAPTGYHSAHIEIEADASAAAYPLVAAAITGGEIGVEGIPPGSAQPDIYLVEVLQAMGCAVRHSSARLELRGPDGPLRAVDVDMERAPDAALALAVACLFADGASRLRGLGTLRSKETDRLDALRTEIARLGADATIDGTDLLIEPGQMRPATVETYDDHRMAMAFALVGLVVPGIEINDPGCVSKTWPEYFDVLDQIRG